MKPNFKILLFSWLVFSSIILLPCFSFAQKPPHLDSLIFLPENEPIPYDPGDGILIYGSDGPYPDYGFESNPALSAFKTKEDIWRNAPIIVEGRTQSGIIRNDIDEYPSLIVSNKEIYDVLPYALSYVYRGDVKGDTIYVLMPRYNYNKVQPPYSKHECRVGIFGPKYYSIAFIKPIVINGFTYYTPCNTDYQGFEWINGASKFYDNRCQTNYYTKKEIFEIFIQKG
ncbi:MAG: hypothetical protein J5I59_12745 [Saprospiraceae bacterium]|nr:hypothetical protein [Saprospiraceae bacterium]